MALLGNYIMKIFLFTNFTPTRDNYRGPSAMMYHFIKNRSKECEFLVYTTNSNLVPINQVKSVSEELGTNIYILEDTIYNYFHRRETLQEIRIKLHIDKGYNISNYKLSSKHLNYIEDFNPDIVWIYGETHTEVIKQLSKYRLLVAGYDCFSLHYNRLMKDSYCYLNKEYYKKALFNYKIAISREMALKDIPCKYFDVGIADRNMFETITGREDAQFYPHPHFDVFPKEINFNKQHLSILIAGKLDQYTWSDAQIMLKALCNESQILKEKFTITILGKDWEKYANTLKNAGYNVCLKKWVDTYADEIKLHDIQLFPISVGSGTKGKVLVALSMGLLCVGSNIAMENIFIKDRHSCYIYQHALEIPSILLEIYNDKCRSAKIAEQGRKQVLKWHNPQRILSIICDDVMGNKSYNGINEYNEVIKDCTF